MNFLFEYCQGDVDFPTEILQNAQVSEEGIDFVKSLLTVNPKNRPTAAKALQSPWLGKVANDWYENLEREFSVLGVNMELKDREKGILVKKAHKADIMRFLPTSAKELPDILERAVAMGLDSAVLMLLSSPSSRVIDGAMRGRLF